jgi:isoquinoline 1-oxidoreductase subunit beta
MNYIPKMNRRSFIVTAAAAGGGLALGLDIPFGGPQPILAQDGSPEVTAWVVIRPDDTVVIRVARSEMGQGTLTGLCQLVAEELECDWSKVTWEYPTPGQSVARKRVWGDFSTGGSRGIRMSHEYVRKGGATAREMLKQKPKPTDADIDAAITNICRCGTYQQIRAAIHAAANA